MHGRSTTADQILARIAERAHGVADRDELLSKGVSDEQISTRLHRGSLIVVHKGVYRVGHAAPTTEATYMAAVKACGKGAVISGKAAAHLHGLIRSKTPPPPEVTAPSKHHLLKVVVHRRRTPPETTRVKNIPTTTIPRTLVDLAAVLNEEGLGRAVHEALIRGTKPHQIEAALAKTPNAKGSKALCRILRGDAQITLSKLERRFLQLLKKHRLPVPKTNKRENSFFVDCRWPEHNLTVELDGYRYHASRHAWEKDRQREREARARKDEFRRYSWDDITGRPKTVIRELNLLLAPTDRVGHQPHR